VIITVSIFHCAAKRPFRAEAELRQQLATAASS
jgi:hypothetical protein